MSFSHSSTGTPRGLNEIIAETSLCNPIALPSGSEFVLRANSTMARALISKSTSGVAFESDNSILNECAAIVLQCLARKYNAKLQADQRREIVNANDFSSLGKYAKEHRVARSVGMVGEELQKFDTKKKERKKKNGEKDDDDDEGMSPLQRQSTAFLSTSFCSGTKRFYRCSTPTVSKTLTDDDGSPPEEGGRKRGQSDSVGHSDNVDEKRRQAVDFMQYIAAEIIQSKFRQILAKNTTGKNREQKKEEFGREMGTPRGLNEIIAETSLCNPIALPSGSEFVLRANSTMARALISKSTSGVAFESDNSILNECAAIVLQCLARKYNAKLQADQRREIVNANDFSSLGKYAKEHRVARSVGMVREELQKFDTKKKERKKKNGEKDDEGMSPLQRQSTAFLSTSFCSGTKRFYRCSTPTVSKTLTDDDGSPPEEGGRKRGQSDSVGHSDNVDEKRRQAVDFMQYTAAEIIQSKFRQILAKNTTGEKRAQRKEEFAREIERSLIEISTVQLQANQRKHLAMKQTEQLKKEKKKEVKRELDSSLAFAAALTIQEAVRRYILTGKVGPDGDTTASGQIDSNEKGEMVTGEEKEKAAAEVKNGVETKDKIDQKAEAEKTKTTTQSQKNEETKKRKSVDVAENEQDENGMVGMVPLSLTGGLEGVRALRDAKAAAALKKPYLASSQNRIAQSKSRLKGLEEDLAKAKIRRQQQAILAPSTLAHREKKLLERQKRNELQQSGNMQVPFGNIYAKDQQLPPYIGSQGVGLTFLFNSATLTLLDPKAPVDCLWGIRLIHGVAMELHSDKFLPKLELSRWVQGPLGSIFPQTQAFLKTAAAMEFNNCESQPVTYTPPRGSNGVDSGNTKKKELPSLKNEHH